jgi:hypothetical protein
MNRAPGRGAERPRALCACTGRGFRRCAEGRGHVSGEAGWPLQLDAGTLELPATLQPCSANGSYDAAA